MRYISANSHKYIQIKVVLLSLIFFLMNACFSVKPASSKSGKKYFESFYVGEDGSQYYIKPLLFKDDDADEALLVDITFRYRNEIKDSAIVNFTIKSPLIYKTIDSLKLSNEILEINSTDIVLLFNEKSNKGFTSRFTTHIALDQIKKMFHDDEWNFIIYDEIRTNKYKPHRSTKKAITSLRDKVFILM